MRCYRRAEAFLLTPCSDSGRCEFVRLTLCGVDGQTGATSSRTKVKAWHRVSFLETGGETSTCQSVCNIALAVLRITCTGTHKHKGEHVEVVTAEQFEEEREQTERKDAADTSNRRGL